MLDNKVLFVLILLVILVLFKFSMKKKENFWGLPSRTWYVDRMLAKDGKFYSTPKYNALLSPRFANTDFGAHLRYNMPEYKNLGSPSDPLASKDMISEDYFASGNYNNVIDSLEKDKVVTNDLPVGDMTMVNELGETVQPIVYDRFIYANRNSRLRSQGDHIRGDLPIVPCNPGWFKPSVHPNIDLHEGAMNVLAGPDNSTTKELSQLINSYSGGADTTIAGVNMNTDFSTTLSSGRNDVTVTAFP